MSEAKVLDSTAGRAVLDDFRATFHGVLDELGKVVVGQRRQVESLLTGMLADGHVMLTGVPGLGRTLLGTSLAKVLGFTSSRIQFTPDLLPTDITGTEVLQESPDHSRREFHFFKGPVFANLVLADEINRSPARTQSALLEVMQERQVSVGGHTYPAPLPFLLIATQNSLETEGVYPLPEAQMDRFIMSIEMDYPSAEEEKDIIDLTTVGARPEVKQVLDPEKFIQMQKLAISIPVVPAVKRFTLALVTQSRPGERGSPPEMAHMVRWGVSPRGGQCLLRAAKVWAITQGRSYVSRQDIKDLAYPVFAHRIILDFRAEARGLSVREVVDYLSARCDAQYGPSANSRRLRQLLAV